MKVLFVYPNLIRTHTPQMGLLCLGSMLLEAGVETEVCDLTFAHSNDSDGYLLRHVERFKPDILGFSCRTLEFPMLSELAAAVRTARPDLLTLAGGPHATFFPEEMAPLVDYLVRGEGEGALTEIVSAVESGRRGDIGDIDNVAFLSDDGELVSRPLRPMVDLAHGPMPRWDLFAEPHYRQHSFLSVVPGARTAGVFEGSRGCPYTCRFCSNVTLQGLYKGAGAWRREKPAEKIAREAESFRASYDMDMMYFIDEVIMTSDRRTKELREHLEPIATPIVFMERAELVRPERIADLKACGAYSCAIGVESGNEAFRAEVLDRHTSDEVIKRAVRLTREAGVKAHVFTMMGLPHQTPAIMQETYDLIKEMQPDTLQASTFFPLPGTPLHEECVRTGLFTPQRYPASYYGYSALNYPRRHKRIIQKYAQALGLGLWRDRAWLRPVEWLCFHVPGLMTLVYYAVMVWGSLKRIGLRHTFERAKAELTSRRRADGIG